MLPAAGMTMLESILSQMYEISQTSCSRQYNDPTPRTNIATLHSAHRYGFAINFTAPSIAVLVLSVIPLLKVCAQAFIHFDVYSKGDGDCRGGGGLLKPIFPMNYSAAHPGLQQTGYDAELSPPVASNIA